MWFQTYGYYQLIVYNDQELEYDPYHYGYVTTKNSDEWNCTRKDWIVDDFSRLETSVYRGMLHVWHDYLYLPLFTYILDDLCGTC